MTPLILALAGLTPASHPGMVGPVVGFPDSPPAAQVFPPWTDSAAPAAGCPGPASHPFQRLPRICPAIPCECGGDATADGRMLPLWVHEFHHAAHFPYPRFGPDGCPLPGDGLLIYEGMRLTVYRDGTYVVAFTATVPDMPVTVRLQLKLSKPNTAEEPYYLTLPPIRLQPKRDAEPGDPAANTFHVAHRGYSSLLQPRQVSVHLPLVPLTSIGPLAVKPAVVDPGWAVTRAGSARFGSVRAVDDQGR